MGEKIRCPHCDKKNEPEWSKFFVCVHCGKQVFHSQLIKKMEDERLHSGNFKKTIKVLCNILKKSS